jgi:RNA polymerase sigma-70 factor (ECF subfamily)
MKLYSKNNEELMIIYRDSNPDQAYQAFECLYSRTSQALYSFLIKKTRQTEEAQDLLQKTFLRVHQCKQLYSPKYKFEQWLFAIAKNVMLDEWRRKNRESKKLENSRSDNQDDQNIYIHDCEKGTLVNLLDYDRELLELKYLDELTYAEISCILNKTETSLRKMVSRIVKKLNFEG